MRSSGDVARLSTFGTAGDAVPQPGADRPFPDCGCTVPPALDVDAVRFLTEVQLVDVVSAATAACLHRCPGWPERRREL